MSHPDLRLLRDEITLIDPPRDDLEARIERHGLTGPITDLLDLLDSQAHRDTDGPGWLKMSREEHAEHLYDHADDVLASAYKSSGSSTVDPETGFDEALHAAARALFVRGTR